MTSNSWIKFLKMHSGHGMTMKQLSKLYKQSNAGCGLSGGYKSSMQGSTLSGGKRKKRKSKVGGVISGGVPSGGAKVSKGALAALLQGLNANINVK